MPAASLLTLIDDIATVLDDVSVMTKVAAKKTAGVLGDDLALNAEQVTGVTADRELPVVFAVAKGSMVNKVILVPAALLISAFAPPLVTVLLMLGGAFLCFEGAEKVLHKLFHKADADDGAHAAASAAPGDEAEKIKGAVRTDFVLSAEIIVIALGTVADKPLATQLGVLTAISVVMVLGVYGLVGLIVKLDDIGLHLTTRGGGAAGLGRAILAGAPLLMKGLGIAGTVAMFLVGGGIVAHGVHAIAEQFEHWAAAAGPLGGLVGMALNGAMGLAVGLVIVALVTAAKRLRGATA